MNKRVHFILPVQPPSYYPDFYESDKLLQGRLLRTYLKSPFFNKHEEYGTPQFSKKKRSGSLKRYNSKQSTMNHDLSSSQSGSNDKVEITQITNRIFAWTFPKSGLDSAYRQSIKEISESFKKRYRDKYKIINVSQKRSDLGRANSGVCEFGWPDRLAPPLDRLCSICKQIENHLNANPENVIVIHCKGWRSKASIVIAAYMNYNSICESGGDVADRFSMQLFADKYIGADGQPSHKRYVIYFSNLLSGQSKVNQQQVFLNHLKISHLPGKEILIKIYERMKPVYSSSKIHMKDEVTLNIEGGLGLRGDVLLKCFTINKESSDKQKERSLLFQCQFNTCAIDFNEVNNLLRFYKEELDFVFMDQSVNNQAYIEFGFNFEHSREGSLRRRKQSFSEFSRADSYENFDRAEDHDRSITVDPLYSEINKTPAITNLPLQSTSVGGLANNSIALPSPIDGTDSGIGSDSPKNMTNAPKVPPKPSKAYYPESNGYASNEDAQRSSAIPEENHTTREHSVLPAGLRKISSRPSSPATTINEYTPNTNGSVVNLSAGRQTPSFEPDLVGKDRYDKNSKCFSYVPAKALNEHFTLPKKAPSMRRLSIERSDLDVPDTCELKEKLKTMNLKGADIQRRCETPKWDFEIDALTNSNGGFEADTCKRSTSTVPRSHSPHDFNDLMRLATPVNVPSSPIQQYSRDNKRPTEHILASLRSNGYNEDTLKSNRYNTPEIPVVQDQARRAVHTSTPNSKYFNSTKPASNNYEDTSQSEMEELCDPDYYLTYSAKTPKSAPPVSTSNNGRGNTFDYSRMNKGASQRDLDDMNSLVDSATLPTQRSCTTPKPIPSWKMSTMKADTPDYSQQHKDDFRYRNCKSVAASPISSTRKLFSNDRYDATTDATDPDHWLGSKLKQLQSKRQSQPDLTTRRKTEKMLLAELKKSNTDEGRGANESNYTSEGQGKRPSDYRDPLNDYMYEEERLKNTKSPFTYDDFSSMRSNYNTPTNYLYNDSSNYGSRPASRAARPTSSLGQRSVPRGKPPTPPPGRDFRDRSRSPAKSPATVKQRFSAAPPEMQSQYQVERNKISGHQKQSSNSYHKPIDYSSDESDNSQGGDDNEFSHLRSIVETNVSRPTSRTAQPYSVRSNTSTPFVADYQNNNTNIYSPSPIPAKRYVNRLPLEEAFSNNSILADSVQGQRSETPAFPIVRDTPLPFHPLLYNGAGTSPSRVNSSLGQSENRNMTSLNYRSQSPRSQLIQKLSNGTLNYSQQRRPSSTMGDNGEVIHHHPIFVRDTSKYWYKPAISREDAINMLKDKSPGTFVVRDSNSFPGAFGLALKVSAPPPGVNVTDGTELVRHFLIEPSPKGVRLKGCANEPVFGTLAALVYQHSITALALPTKLLLPEFDSTGSEHLSATQALLEQGAACNVVYVCSIETESLTGPEALRRSVAEAFRTPRVPQGSRGVSVHFKVSSQGITLTDNTRTLFFRRHYPVQSVTYAGVSDSQCISYGMSGNSPNNAITFIGVGGADETRSFGGNTYPEGFPRQIDPEDRKWDNGDGIIQTTPNVIKNAKIFGFVARKTTTGIDNLCHIFAEMDPEQPASAVVNFITKVMMASQQRR